jgi:DNA replication and repair protein RecF
MLRRIALSRFRNFESADVMTGARDVFFVGENGQGKTNLLEAAYFLSYASSFRSSADGESVMYGQEEAEIEGEYSKGAGENGEKVKIRLGRERKSVHIDGKSIQDRRDLIQAHPCVVFGHEDMDFAVGGPERRRFFFDQTAALAFPLFLDFFRDYKRTLKLRNACLRDGRNDLIEIMDEQLVKHGMDLMEARIRAVDAFSSMFTEVYEVVSRLPYRVEISYQPSWSGESDARKKLREVQQSDFERGLTSTGPHRDRFIFKALGRNFAKSASTGQLRLLSLVLRSCQARYYRETSGKKPILLMDDVLLELDPEKRKRFMNTLPEREQTFSTFLPGEPYDSYKGEDTLVYAIVEGKASLLEGDFQNA